MTLFQQNLQLLKQRDPALADRVAGERNDVQASLRNTPSERPTVVVQGQGQAIALHHPDDPLGHTRAFLDSMEAWKKSRNIAVIGGGLGYAPLLIHQASPKLQNLFVIEPSITVFRAALQAVDLSALLRDRRVRFIVGAEPGAVYASLVNHVVDLVANPLVAQEIPSVTSAFPEWAQSAKQQIVEVMQFGQSGLFTKFKDGPLTLKNLLQNLDSIAETPGLSRLSNAFHGMPAIVAAAGPSLKKNVDRLKQAGNAFLVIACDTALELLLKRGITPHIAITVDPTELNVKHFPRDSYGEDTVLLYDPESRPEVVGKFSRRLTFMTDKHPFFEWLDRQAGGKGIIPKGSMVSQSGVYAARFLGCDPIILIGQDLALDPETGHTHIPDTAYCRKAEFLSDDRQHIDIPIPVGDGSMSRENLFWVEGVDGEPVPTVQNFLVYIRMLEKDIRTYNLNLIDATEGGAKIQGTTLLTLEEAIRRHRSAMDASKILESMDRSGETIPVKTKELKQSLQKILESRIQLSRDARKKLERSSNLSQAALDRAIQTYRERIFANPAAEYLIEYGAPRELFEFMKLGPATLSEEEERERTLARVNCLLDAVPQAAERLLELL